jgi:hypothetical protein
MKANKIMITQAELKELLTYNPETGIFNWIKRNGNIAGSRHNQGYTIITVNRQKYLAHRLAWFYVKGSFPSEFIDHINHICHDNRITNLRQATFSQNQHNRRLNVNNSSGFKGVYWNKSANKWQSQIQMSGIKKGLGLFTDKNEAHQAYCKAANKYHKEFANHG